MRKPRDYDAELKAIDERAKALRTRRRDQLGELVLATGAGTLPVETLAGALLGAAAADATTKEAWRASGAAFFRGAAVIAAAGTRCRTRSTTSDDDRPQSADGEASAS